MAPSFGLKPPALGWVDLIATGVPESDDRADLSIALATYQQQMSDIDGIDSKASSTLTFAVGVAVAPLAFVASRETGPPDGAVGFFVAGFVVFLVAAVMILWASHVRNWRSGVDLGAAYGSAQSDEAGYHQWWLVAQLIGSVSGNTERLHWKARMTQIAASLLATETVLVGSALLWVVLD